MIIKETKENALKNINKTIKKKNVPISNPQIYMICLLGLAWYSMGLNEKLFLKRCSYFRPNDAGSWMGANVWELLSLWSFWIGSSATKDGLVWSVCPLGPYYKPIRLPSIWRFFFYYVVVCVEYANDGKINVSLILKNHRTHGTRWSVTYYTVRGTVFVNVGHHFGVSHVNFRLDALHLRLKFTNKVAYCSKQGWLLNCYFGRKKNDMAEILQRSTY